MSKGFRFGMSIQESCEEIIRQRTYRDPRANARFAAHSIVRELLRESKFEKDIVRDMIVTRKWFPEVVEVKYNVSKSLLTYTMKVALEATK